jgi:hypothetical protein
MRLRNLIPVAALAAFAAAPGVASADTLLAPAPQGSQNLTSGGGYMAWAQPNSPAGTGFRLAVRAPDGTVSTANTPVFEEVPDPSIGTDSFGVPRNLLMVYTRAGDVYSYDLRRNVERKVRQISTSAIERGASINFGNYAFVRVNGRRAGVYHWSARNGLRRVTADVPRELAYNGSRVAYPLGRSVVIRRVSGQGNVARIRNTARPESIVLARYRASWLVGDKVFKTTSFGGSGRAQTAAGKDEGSRELTGANSIAFGRGDRVQLALDGEGVKRLSPTPFGSRG